MSNSKLDFDLLKRFVCGDAVAIRGRATLIPAGGDGDKVFPPTHAVDDRTKSPGAKYAFEDRRIDGQTVKCVLLDSVQSQANRIEEALQSLWDEGRIALPVIEVDLSKCAPEVGKVTSLTAPHRIADAILRDSFVDGKTLFRMSDLGRSFSDATPRNATSLFKVCPTALVFGLWDSTGPKGGLGSKFARALVSEIVGIGAQFGRKTQSRIDPLGIVKGAAEAVYVAKNRDEFWTLDASQAQQDKKGPLKAGSKSEGKVTDVNHSNIPPSIDDVAGGVSIDHAIHTAVLSLAGFRRLQFSEGPEEARTLLTALGLLGILAAEDRGHDLRSRCLLVPKAGENLKLEAVLKDGAVEPFSLDLSTAISLYDASVKALPAGLRFSTQPKKPLAVLTPSPKLAHLITKSRDLAAVGVEVDE